MDARAEPCLVLTVREEKDGEYETLWAPGGAGVRPARWGMHPSYHFMCMFCFNVQFQVALAAISYWVIYPLPYPAPSLFTPPLQSSQVELVSNFCSTNVSSCPRVLIRCFFNAGALPSTPSNSSLSAVDPRFYIYALTILLPFDCAFHHRFLHSHFQDVNSNAKQLPGSDVEEEWNIYILVSNIPCL